MQKSKNRISRVRLHIISNQPLSTKFKERVLQPIGSIAVEQHVWDLSRLRSVYESDREREVVTVSISDFDVSGIECMRAAGSESIQSYEITFTSGHSVTSTPSRGRTPPSFLRYRRATSRSLRQFVSWLSSVDPNR